MKKRPPKHQLIKTKNDMMQSLLSDDRFYMTTPKTSLRLPVARTYAQYSTVQEEMKAEINGEQKALEKKLAYTKTQLQEIVEDIEKPHENDAQGEVGNNSTIHVKIK